METINKMYMLKKNINFFNGTHKQEHLYELVQILTIKHNIDPFFAITVKDILIKLRAESGSRNSNHPLKK